MSLFARITDSTQYTPRHQFIGRSRHGLDLTSCDDTHCTYFAIETILIENARALLNNRTNKSVKNLASPGSGHAIVSPSTAHVSE